MNIKKYSGSRLTILLGYLGLVGFLLGCMAVTGGSPNAEQGMLQLDNGLVKVKSQSGDWEPVAGTSSFELVAPLENTNPWTVAGRVLETNELTQIEEGLQVGDAVRVRGAILENDTWLVYSIESTEEQTNQTIVLIGTVSSLDPWVVNGITLNVTQDTVISGEITPGMLVRVEILLLEDGTWEVLSIAPLGDLPQTAGCATVTATIESVSGDQIRFLGWPTTVTLDTNGQADNDNENENDNGNENTENTNDEENGENTITFSPGQKVLVVVCATEDGQLVIRQIIVLDDEDDDEIPSDNGEKVLVCHKPDKKGGHTISIASAAVPAHLGHGDKVGPCP